MRKLLACLLLIAGPALGQDTVWVVGELDATKIYSTGPTYNYGSSTSISIKNNLERRALVKFTAIEDSIGTGQNIIEWIVRIHSLTLVSGGYVGVYETLKPWFEGTSSGAAENGATCYDEWYYHTDDGTDSLWQSGGADSTSDTRPQNRADGTDADRRATAMDSVDVNASDSYFNLNVDTALANAWYNGTKSNFGVILIQQNDYVDIALGSDDITVDSQKVRIGVIYESLSASSVGVEGSVIFERAVTIEGAP